MPHFLAGSWKVSNAIIIEKAVEPFVDVWIDNTASKNPVKRLPESPRKIFAGLKL